ncbi:MAG TPA: hypothetical protein VH352_17345, partial [Pseudonocardiaceae bacterium]|nr:hypothetical protein [Pseudonocardiaceae bacterium]
MHRPLAALLVSVALLLPAPALAARLPSTAPTTDIVTLLHQIPKVTYLAEVTPAPTGFREFSLEFQQPIDHRHQERGTFEQHVTLLHKDFNAPMVAFTSGYFNYESFGVVYISETTMLTGGNQLDIEHRFFGDSLPSPSLTPDLNIWQEATDEHDIVDTFKHVYQKPWLATGWPRSRTRVGTEGTNCCRTTRPRTGGWWNARTTRGRTRWTARCAPRRASNMGQGSRRPNTVWSGCRPRSGTAGSSSTR